MKMKNKIAIKVLESLGIIAFLGFVYWLSTLINLFGAFLVLVGAILLWVVLTTDNTDID